MTNEKTKAAKELANLLTEEELTNAVAGAKKLREEGLDSPLASDNGHQTFNEAESREVVYRDEAKLNIAKYITKPEAGIRNIMPTTEIPGALLMHLVMGIHVDEMLNPERRALLPTETPEENMYGIYCYAMKGFNRKGLKELLHLGELEASEKSLGDNLTPQVMQ